MISWTGHLSSPRPASASEHSSFPSGYSPQTELRPAQQAFTGRDISPVQMTHFLTASWTSGLTSTSLWMENYLCSVRIPISSWVVVAHTFNLSIQEAEAGRSLSSRPAWSTEAQKIQGHTEKPWWVGWEPRVFVECSSSRTS